MGQNGKYLPKIAKNGQKRPSKWTKIGQKWPKMAENGQKWPKMTKNG